MTLGSQISSTVVPQLDPITKGQRTINLIWETTQGLIALTITCAIVYCAIYGISNTELTNAFFLIVGFYFSRTNYASINGSLGSKPSQTYESRQSL